MYRLKRLRDGKGDSGDVSTLFWMSDGEIKFENHSKPRVGVAIQVGSSRARTMQWQDYWQTSYITEILEDTGDYIKFKTGNSIYEWRNNV